jgi:hypothetical protein
MHVFAWQYMHGGIKRLALPPRSHMAPWGTGAGACARTRAASRQASHSPQRTRTAAAAARCAATAASAAVYVLLSSERSCTSALLRASCARGARRLGGRRAASAAWHAAQAPALCSPAGRRPHPRPLKRAPPRARAGRAAALTLTLAGPDLHRGAEGGRRRGALVGLARARTRRLLLGQAAAEGQQLRGPHPHRALVPEQHRQHLRRARARRSGRARRARAPGLQAQPCGCTQEPYWRCHASGRPDTPAPPRVHVVAAQLMADVK